MSSGFRNSNKNKKLMTVLIFTHPLSRFYHLFRHLHNICVLREAHWDPLDHPVRSHAFYYILARFIAKSNAFCHFYRKIQCVQKRLHIYSMSIFLANLMCFVTTYLKNDRQHTIVRANRRFRFRCRFRFLF